MKNLIYFILIASFFISDNGWNLNMFDWIGEVTGVGAPFQILLPGICWLFLFLIFTHKKIPLKTLKYKWIVYGLFMNIFISSVFGSVLYYGEPTSFVFQSIFLFGGINIYFILSAFSEKQIITKKLFDWLIGYAMVYSIFIMAIFFIPSLSDLLSQKVLTERFNNVRIQDIGSFTLFAMCYFLACFFIKAEKKDIPPSWFIYSGLFLTMFVNFFVAQSRGFAIGLLGLLFVIGFLSFKNKKFNSKAWKFNFFLLISLVLFFSDIQNSDFIKSLNPNGEDNNSISVRIRLEGAKYYFNELVNTHFIGIGWMPAAEHNPIDNSIKRAYGVLRYFPNDLGYLGVFITFGVFAIVVCFFYFKISFYMVRRIMDVGLPEQRLIGCTVWIFLVLELSAPMNGYSFYWRQFTFIQGLIFFLLDRTYRSVLKSPNVTLDKK